jgi:mycothiol synthase
MGPLSNLGLGRDGQDRSTIAFECRPADRTEIEPALRLLLSDSVRPASDDHVLDFLAFALHRRIDVAGLWITVLDGRILWTLLPVPSPGRTMLLFSPSRIPRKTPLRAIRELVQAVGAFMQERSVDLAQLLIDPRDQPIIHAYANCGFEELAELLYLQRAVPGNAQMPDLPEAIQLQSYSESLHHVFGQTILRSYEASFDCPALNGRRHIEDIIAGHKAAGEFNPQRWLLLSENDLPRAVLLLNSSPHSDGVELVYLGLVPEARGRGIGDLMIQIAFAQSAADQRMQLSLAVDSRNTPALKLYYRHGMHRVSSRIAMIRDLRRSTAPLLTHPAAT